MKSKIEKELAKLKNSRGIYPFLLLLYLLVKVDGVPVTFNEISAMSGYPLRFLYKLDFLRVFDCSKDFILRNLNIFSGIKISVKEFSRIEEGKPFIIEDGSELFFREEDEDYSVSNGVIGKKHPLLQGPVFVVENSKKIERKAFYSTENFVLFSRLLRKEFFLESTTISKKVVLAGKTAFTKFVEDLKRKDISEEESEQMLYSFKIQTGVSASVPVYLLGLHHFIERKFQDSLSSAIGNFEDFSMYIRECDRIIGKRGIVSFTDRRRISNSLKRAVSSYEKGALKLYEIEMEIS